MSQCRFKHLFHIPQSCFVLLIFIIFYVLLIAISYLIAFGRYIYNNTLLVSKSHIGVHCMSLCSSQYGMRLLSIGTIVMHIMLK